MKRIILIENDSWPAEESDAIVNFLTKDLNDEEFEIKEITYAVENQHVLKETSMVYSSLTKGEDEFIVVCHSTFTNKQQLLDCLLWFDSMMIRPKFYVTNAQMLVEELMERRIYSLTDEMEMKLKSLILSFVENDLVYECKFDTLEAKYDLEITGCKLVTL